MALGSFTILMDQGMKESMKMEFVMVLGSSFRLLQIWNTAKTVRMARRCQIKTISVPQRGPINFIPIWLR